MADSFDAHQYAAHLHRHWRFAAVVCAIAIAIAGGISLLLPKKYTATARIVIEPPAGTDLRVAMAVSPIYLESLKTYEHFASSDGLLLRALEKFGLRTQGDNRPIESWRQALHVEIPKNTKILEISATLRDPAKALALARYVAEQTIELNRTANLQADEDLIREAERAVAESRARLDRANAEWNRLAATAPTAGLDEEIKSANALRSELQQNLNAAEMVIVEDSARQGDSNGQNQVIGEEVRLARARAETLRKSIATADREIARKQGLLAERSARADTMAAERKDAEAAFSAAQTRLREVRSVAGNRGEQLNIIDPGITPERPSSPNAPLNVIAALLLGMIVSIGYLTFEYGLERQKAQSKRTTFRIAANE